MIKQSMDKKLKKKWLKALRSGDYDQGTGALCKIQPGGGAQYCCLGVLMEEVHGDDWQVTAGTTLSMGANTAYPEHTDLDRWGLRGDGIYGVCADRYRYQQLAGMNDNGKSFHEIADFIEENL